MPMLRKTTTVVLAATLGTGAAIGVAACGEDRSGDVQFEDGTGTTRMPEGFTETAGTTEGEATAPSTTPAETPTETTP
jgi:hypothetical protein